MGVRHWERGWEFPILALRVLAVSKLTQLIRFGRGVSLEGSWIQK